MATVAGAGEEGDGIVKVTKENRCQYWLPNKRRNCANSRLPLSLFCGNHDSSAGDRRLPCPLDPSHSVSKENLGSHLRKCPLRKQAVALEAQAYYSKGINCGSTESVDDNISSEAKRAAIYGLNLSDFLALVKRIESLHTVVVGVLENSYLMPDACNRWLNRQIDSKIPYQEKHVLQQASILGNMERFGVLCRPNEENVSPGNEEDNGDDFVQKEGEAASVVEFGAGRGYLTHMLADSYGIRRIFLVERRSYKLKADRSLRQNESILLERLRLDIEDLDLHAVKSLNGQRYLAVGKHLCGNATDTSFFLDHGLTKEHFYSITWFSSWAVDADHSSSNQPDRTEINASESNESPKHFNAAKGFSGVEETIRNMKAVDRAAFGLKCKDIIDMGRVLWLRERGFVTELVKYVPPSISPENRLLMAKFR